MRRINSIEPMVAICLWGCVAVFGTGCGKNSSGPDACVVDDQGNPVPLAHDSLRVDLVQPAFSNPTAVTNPLFAISSLHSAILLGAVDGEVLRVEVTLLPGTKAINLDGESIQTLESQYVAFLDGRIEEVALDWYGQDDNGAVWYFGEDVFNYADGVIEDREGTWLAGADGPAAMIMPASPKVGNVYRPENICGVVFEEVTVKLVGQTVAGPRGPVAGAITVEELHMDGAYEDKTFAPGYGEFSTGAGADLEALALAVPIDALLGPPPAQLQALTNGANEIYEASLNGDWSSAATSLADVSTAWNEYQVSGTPPMLRTQMDAALSSTSLAVNAQNDIDARQGAIDLARATQDFLLRYRPPSEIDIARSGLWARQIMVDADDDEPDDIKGDVTALEWTRDRFAHTLGSATLTQLDNILTELRLHADGENLDGAAEAAQQLRVLIEGL